MRATNPPNATKQTIAGISPERYAARFKAERAKLKRHYCSVFKFWRTCRLKTCIKARACAGDARDCFKHGIAAVPRAAQWDARQEILAATSPSAGPPERAARECLPSEL
jgi:hypothetical protein